MSPWLVLFALTSRTVAVTGAETGPVHVRCPAAETTEIAFAEPLRQLKASADDRRRFGITVVRTKPTGTIAVHPTGAGGTARVEFRGPSHVVELVLEAVPPSLPEPTPAPTPEPVAAAPAPTPIPSPPPATQPPVTAPPATATAEASGLVWAKSVVIGRREGLPGQRSMVLVDALSGQDTVWLRFRLEDGASEEVARVHWEHGEVTTFEQVADGPDRRVVVQLPRARVTPKTRVTLELSRGPAYRFALTAPTLARLFRSLFR
ncbi:MAG: hypothetical protein ABW221_23030 [Vicinamibacteria bacterium]